MSVPERFGCFPNRTLITIVLVTLLALGAGGVAIPGDIATPRCLGGDGVGGCGDGRGFVDTLFGYFTTGLNVIFGPFWGALNEDEDGVGVSASGSSGAGVDVGGFGGSGNRRVQANGNRVNYRNHQLLRAFPKADDQVEELEALMEDSDGLQFWTRPVFNKTTDIVVPPDIQKEIKDFLKERNIDFIVLIKDLQKAIAAQNPRMTKEKRSELRNSRGHEMTFRRYHRYGDMLHYMQYLAATYPKLVEILTIGQSSRGRSLKVAKVSAGGQVTKQGGPKPAVWIDGGMHAREWISPAVALYTLKQLVENFKVNRRVVEAADWYILPVGNPDGYEYTHTTDRLWRKTRSRHAEERVAAAAAAARAAPARSGGRGSRRGRFFWDSCEGVDPNRNWDFHWGEKGASDDPCHETYAGPRPFSEPETRAVANFIMDRRDRVKLFLSLHSYSQMWLMPWGYTYRRTPDYEDMMAMGRKAVEAIQKAGGQRYQVGAATKLLYPTSGGSDDWAKGVAGIKYAYTVELRDKGDYGFLLPASQIVPTGRETFAAIKTLVRSIACKT